MNSPRPRRPGGGRPMPMSGGSLLSVAPPTSSAFVSHQIPSPSGSTDSDQPPSSSTSEQTTTSSSDFHSPLATARPNLTLFTGINRSPPLPPSKDPQEQNVNEPKPMSLRPSLSLVYGDDASQPARPAAPKLSLGLKIGSGASSTSKPPLGLQIPTDAPSTRPGDSPLDSYYNAPLLAAQKGSDNPSTSLFAPQLDQPQIPDTIRPQTATITPASARSPDIHLSELQKAINAINVRPSQFQDNPEEEEESIQWNPDLYEQIKRLGEGAGGAVYQVKEKSTGKIMAMKTIPANPETPPEQLQRELSFLSTCIHPNITEFYRAFLSTPSSNTADVHLLMEFCEGGSLEAISRKVRQQNRRIGEPVVGKLAIGILHGLDYLHGRKIIHRDIKPSNIVLTREGVVKLCDFGVSGVLVNSMAGTFTGTSWYMSPERIRGDPYTIRSDVWSTGLTLLELAQNRFPYPPDLGPIELLSYIVNGEVPELEDEPPGPDGTGGATWSEAIKKFIKRCLTVNDTMRPSPKEILQDPWVIQSEQVHLEMDRWMRQVWGWPKPAKPGRRKVPRSAGSTGSSLSQEIPASSLSSGGGGGEESES